MLAAPAFSAIPLSPSAIARRPSMNADDHRHMARALTLAARGLYSTDPNPRVGCVLVRDGEVVGEGWHGRAGEPHAEVFALRAAGERARGATVYVTLEPCCHHGRTPPCSDALIAAGVARVVCEMTDTNPQVAGQGLAQLAAAGGAVETSVLAADAAALNPGFISRLQRGRARSAAIMTGIDTVLADDPLLIVRLPAAEWAQHGSGPVRQPLRVVLDSRLRLPATARLLTVPGEVQVFTCAADSAASAAVQATGATMTAVSAGKGGVDLGAVLTTLGAEGINELWAEAGPRLGGALLEQGWVDELVLYMAPKLLGDGARGLFRLPEWQTLAECVDVRITDMRAVGADWRIMARIDNNSR